MDLSRQSGNGIAIAHGGNLRKRENSHGSQEIRQAFEQGEEARTDHTVEIETESAIVAQSSFFEGPAFEGRLRPRSKGLRFARQPLIYFQLRNSNRLKLRTI